MIYAAIQVAALLFSSFMLVRYHAHAAKHRYRFFVSLFAMVWTALSTACALAILLSWPEAISESNFLTALGAVLSAGMAYWCGGNVADLLRKLDRLVG